MNISLCIVVFAISKEYGLTIVIRRHYRETQVFPRNLVESLEQPSD